MCLLPIDNLLDEIVERLRRSPSLVIEAPPGAGKTTRVPPALLGLNLGEVWVLEPRRIAARLAARRVSAEHGEPVGETVGYQVRFEDVSGPKTRLRFLTEGVLTRRLQSNPDLRGVGVVILDEFHERHLEGDLALALLLRLQREQRPDLRIVVMSATMEAAPVADHLGGAAVIRSEGKLFDLKIEHAPSSADPLEDQVGQALDRLIRDSRTGDVLVFLPGAAEIRRAARVCQPIAERANLLLTPLHGDLPSEDQDRAVQPADRRKVILSTNVAESSLTIEGVTVVIDSGLARIPSHSPWSGLPRLTVQRVSKASATQRAGRAARTAPGRAVRLYPVQDFQRRPDHETPEIKRLELSQVRLTLHAMGVRQRSELPWLDAPPAAAWDAAEELLQKLDAFENNGVLSTTGREMARLPLHPRLARLVVEARSRGVGRDGEAIAALLSTAERLAGDHPSVGPSDLVVLLEQSWSPPTKKLVAQLRRLSGPAAANRPSSGASHDEALLISVLTAFPDRVARRRQATRPSGRKARGKKTSPSAGEAGELLLAGGGSARLSRESVVQQSELLVAVDVEERREHGLPLVRLASAIEPEWLLDLFPQWMSERTETKWNREAERVETVSALLYQDLIIQESRGGAVDPEAASRLLAEKAWEAGVERFVDADELQALLDRAVFASQHGAVREIAEHDLRGALESLCFGLRSFGELRTATQGGGWRRALESRLKTEDWSLLARFAPARLRLANGREVKVHYAQGKPPWIAARLQDFFGMNEAPRVASGQVPVVVHLLAPNHRPVQMTTDLAGFWERHYPEIRRQLSRRYPKHRWPERPTAADAKVKRR